MRSESVNIPIDVFISSAAISYNGPFVGSFRKNLIDYWITVINAKDLSMSSEFQISKVLGDPLVIRDWVIDGLPSDTVSLDNAIFCMQGLKWPLLIDPQ
jgi:dynein heavy chain